MATFIVLYTHQQLPPTVDWDLERCLGLIPDLCREPLGEVELTEGRHSADGWDIQIIKLTGGNLPEEGTAHLVIPFASPTDTDLNQLLCEFLVSNAGLWTQALEAKTQEPGTRFEQGASLTLRGFAPERMQPYLEGKSPLPVM